MKNILPLILFAFCIQFSIAQEKTTLINYIQTLENEFDITFSYDNELLSDLKIIPSNNNGLENKIDYLRENTVFNFERIDGENILITPLEPNKNFKLCIEVLDSEIQDDLIGATVKAKNTDLGFAIDNTGKSETLINTGEWKEVVIEYYSYETQTIPIENFIDNGCLTILLKQKEQELGEVVITYLTSGINYKNNDQSIELNVDRSGLLPGETETDIFNTIEALPGINSPDGKAGNLVMRGSDPDKTMVEFDNIPIYHNGHYFGAFSPYNTDIVKSVSVNRNGYDVNKGGRVGGLIELKSKKKIPDNLEIGVGAGTSYVLAHANVPLIKDKWSFIAGFRSSYPFEWQSPRLKSLRDFIFQNSVLSRADNSEGLNVTNFDFDFSDLNIGTTFTSDKHHIKISILNISNDLNLDVRGINIPPNSPGGPNNAVITDDKNDAALNNLGGNLDYDIFWSDRFKTNASLSISSFEQSFQGEVSDENMILVDSDYINDIRQFSFKTTSQLILKNSAILSLGGDTKYYNLDLERFTIDNQFQNNFEENHDEQRTYSLFGEYEFKNKKVNGSVGFRGTHYSGTDQIYAEPRFLINYNASENITLKASAGLYNQFINHVSGRRAVASGVQQFNWQLSNDSNIPVVSGQQSMLGVIIKQNKWLIDIESYYKTTQDIAVYDIYDYSDATNFFIGDYETIGIDFLIKRSWQRLDTWVSYSIMKTNASFNDIQEDDFRSIWDQRHAFNAVVSYRVKNWKFSAGWKYKSGLASLVNIRDFYINGPPTNGSNPLNNNMYSNALDEDYGEQFPDQHQLDISAAYLLRPKSGKWRGNLGLAITNVYDQNNIVNQRRVNGPMPNTYALDNIFGIGFTPSMLLKFEW